MLVLFPSLANAGLTQVLNTNANVAQLFNDELYSKSGRCMFNFQVDPTCSPTIKVKLFIANCKTPELIDIAAKNVGTTRFVNAFSSHVQPEAAYECLERVKSNLLGRPTIQVVCPSTPAPGPITENSLIKKEVGKLTIYPAAGHMLTHHIATHLVHQSIMNNCPHESPYPFASLYPIGNRMNLWQQFTRESTLNVPDPESYLAFLLGVLNTHLPETQNIYYLMSSLTLQPEQTIQHDDGISDLSDDDTLYPLSTEESEGSDMDEDDEEAAKALVQLHQTPRQSGSL